MQESAVPPSAPVAGGPSRDRWAVFGLVALVLLVMTPFLATGGRIPPLGDYTQYAARHLHLRMAWLEEGRPAERSWLMGGGYPILGDPEDPTFNPLTLCTVLCGEVFGLKLIGVVVAMVAALGAYAFLRSTLRLSSAAAFLGAALFAALPWNPARIADGNPNEIYFGYLPLLLFLIHRARTRPLCFLWASLVLMATLSDGKLVFVTMVMFIGIAFAIDAVTARSHERAHRWKPLLGLALILGLTLVGFLPRILPALELIGQRGGLARMDLHFHADHYAADTIFAYPVSRLLGELVGWPGFMTGRLTSFGFGAAGLLLAAVGFAFALRRALGLAVGAVLFAWWSLAHHALIDGFWPLWHLPVTSAIDAPPKYFGGPVVFTLSVFAALGYQALAARAPKFGHPLGLALVVGLVVLPPAIASARLLERSHRFEPPAVELLAPDERYTVASDGLKRGRFLPLESNTWFNLRRGIGTLDWYSGIPLDEVAIPRFIAAADGTLRPDPRYRGPAFLADGLVPVTARIKHHEISVPSVVLDRPARLVLNQSFHRDWRTSLGVIQDHQGLLAVDLPPGQHALELRYASRALRRGLFGTGVFLAFALAWCWWWRRGGPGAANAGGLRGGVLKRIVQAVIDEPAQERARGARP